MRPLPALPHLANCGRAGGHQKKGKKEEKHWNAPQCQGGPAVPAAHGQARRAGGYTEKSSYNGGISAQRMENMVFNFNILGPGIPISLLWNQTHGQCGIRLLHGAPVRVCAVTHNGLHV